MHNQYKSTVDSAYSGHRSIGSLGQEQNHKNSVNSLRLIGSTPKFRLIGSKYSGTKVIRLSGVDGIYKINSQSDSNDQILMYVNSIP